MNWEKLKAEEQPAGRRPIEDDIPATLPGARARGEGAAPGGRLGVRVALAAERAGRAPRGGRRAGLRDRGRRRRRTPRRRSATSCSRWWRSRASWVWTARARSAGRSAGSPNGTSGSAAVAAERGLDVDAMSGGRGPGVVPGGAMTTELVGGRADRASAPTSRRRATASGGHVRSTPVVETGAGAFGLEPPLVLKLELLQHTGSFKPRGAFNKMLASDVPRRRRRRGVRRELRAGGGLRRPVARSPRRDLRPGHVAGRQDRPHPRAGRGRPA